ncbi:hypothetical protein Q5P01_000540 [Channa striata]|uniref:Ig-like domain-containing protein n=1 Tax=Channa striata TaxID=64152 RepID=A0AA88IBY3_CHASR|nr:hypothetical protein Q5P01_000540 [Channa striata]
MMVGFTWIQVVLVLMLMLQFTVTGQFHSITVILGKDVILPCGNVRHDQEKCNRTAWLFSGSGNTVMLVQLGQINTESNSKSDRLSVTERCSLIIKKVTEEDDGRYSCRQFDKSGRQLGSDSGFDLSVVPSEYLHHHVFTSIN